MYMIEYHSEKKKTANLLYILLSFFFKRKYDKGAKDIFHITVPYFNKTMTS